MYFYMKLKKNSVWYNFYQGTSVSITFYIFEHYQLWMMDSKAQRVFFLGEEERSFQSLAELHTLRLYAGAH